MYGRNQELKQLISAWDQVKENPVELFLVSGYSGIGKTRLIMKFNNNNKTGPGI